MPQRVEARTAVVTGATGQDGYYLVRRLHHVWELIDRAFALAGFELEWQLQGDDPRRWSARFAGTETLAVVVDPKWIRPSDPKAIAADPTRIATELGWKTRAGLDVFLADMLAADLVAQP